MQIGIEFTTVRDAKGRAHYRVFPYFVGTQKQFNNMMIAVLLVITATVFVTLVSANPDPIIKPTITVLP